MRVIRISLGACMLFEPRTPHRWAKVLCASAVAALVCLTGCGPKATNEVVVYSARVEDLIKPLFDRYTKESGVPVRFVTDDAAPLIERLAAEGTNSPADILLTVDAGELWNAAERGLLQPVPSPALHASIPASLRDPKD